MKSFKSSITVVSTFLIVLAIIVSSFITEYSSLISTVTTTVTAVIGAIALFFQFKKDKEINKASFLVEFSKQFYETYNCSEIFNLIEKDVDEEDFDLEKELTKPSRMPQIENYLSWCKTLAALVNDDIVSLKDIDSLFNYRFFMIVNNKVVQKLELVKYYEDYEDVIRLYDNWNKYRIKKNFHIPFEEDGLDKNPKYKNIIISIEKNKKHMVK